MLNEKKLQDHILSMEAAAKLMLSEAGKIRLMLEVKDMVQIDKDAIRRLNFYKSKELDMQRARNKKSLAETRLSNKNLNH
jgi:hypothetical protein